jgi:hypothetical protein
MNTKSKINTSLLAALTAIVSSTASYSVQVTQMATSTPANTSTNRFALKNGGFEGMTGLDEADAQAKSYGKAKWRQHMGVQIDQSLEETKAIRSAR